RSTWKSTGPVGIRSFTGASGDSVSGAAVACGGGGTTAMSAPPQLTLSHAGRSATIRRAAPRAYRLARVIRPSVSGLRVGQVYGKAMGPRNAVADARSMPIESAEFRRILGHWSTGVAVVTARAADGTP